MDTMENPTPEALYREGMGALASGNASLAERKFRAAIVNGKERGTLRPSMRHVSYLGLSMALAHRPSEKSLKLCQRAVDGDPTDPVVFYNLGKLHIMLGDKTKALQAFERGLHLAPHNPRLKREMRRFNRRGRQPFPKLSRDHPLNRHLGRLRAALFSRRTASRSV